VYKILYIFRAQVKSLGGVVVRVSFACSSVFPPGLPRYAASLPYQRKRLRAAPTRQPSIRSSDDQNLSIPVRQVKYLNNILEQDHRAMKRITKQMLGFKSSGHPVMSWWVSNSCTCQMMMEGCAGISFADQLYALAGQMRTA
jgi:hypothetical protein